VRSFTEETGVLVGNIDQYGHTIPSSRISTLKIKRKRKRLSVGRQEFRGHKGDLGRRKGRTS